MSAGKHTAGPFEARGTTVYARGMYPADCAHPSVPDGEQVANAHLFAAAPELLALALRLEPWLAGHEHQEKARGGRQHDSQFLIELRAAIAKATGAEADPQPIPVGEAQDSDFGAFQAAAS